MTEPDQKLKTHVENTLDTEFEWEEIQEGINDIYRIKSEDEEFILKAHTNKHQSSVSYKEDQKARFRAESKIYKLLSDYTDVASPEIIYEDFSEEKYEHGFYIMEKIEGQNLEDTVENLSEKELESVIYQYGKILGHIHNNINFERNGLILYRNNRLEMLEASDKWIDSFDKMLSNLEELVEDRWDEKPQLHISKIRGKMDEIPGNIEPVLLHSDNRLENILVKDANIEGFLDWSFCRAGHNKYDLVRAEYLLIDYDLQYLEQDKKERLRQNLIQGYKEANKLDDNYFDDLRQLYRYITVLWIIAGFPNWSSDWDNKRRKSFAEDLKKRLKKEA